MVKVKYVVEGKEFTNEKDAKKYADKLNLQPKYNEGDICYIVTAPGVIREVKITEAIKMFNSTYYNFIGYGRCVAEDKVYKTPDEYFEHLRSNIIYLKEK